MLEDVDENDSVNSGTGASDLEQDGHGTSGLDDGAEVVESSEEVTEDTEGSPTEKAQAPSKNVYKKDFCNYSKRPLESFETFDPQKPKVSSKLDFDQAGVGRASVKSLKDMQPKEVMDHYWEPCVEHTVAMNDFANPAPCSIPWLSLVTCVATFSM